MLVSLSFMFIALFQIFHQETESRPERVVDWEKTELRTVIFL